MLAHHLFFSSRTGVASSVRWESQAKKKNLRISFGQEYFSGWQSQELISEKRIFLLPEARVNKEPNTEFPEIFLTEPCSGSHWMPYASQRIPQQISCLLGGSFTTEDPPGSTSPGSFSRPLTPMHFSGFSAQIPHQVTLGA